MQFGRLAGDEMIHTLLAQTPPAWESLWNVAPVTGLVFFIMGVIWKVVRWLKPYGERAFEAHISLVTSLERQTKTNTETLSKMGSTMQKQHEMITELYDTWRAGSG